MKNIIAQKAKECIKNLEKENGLIVLKGISNKEFSFDSDLDEMIKEKPTKTWLKIYESRRKIITYEEFLFLYNFITEEYSTIHIINNNICDNLYPLLVDKTLEIYDQLTEFFDPEKKNINDEIKIINGEEYIKIYSNIKKINNMYFVRYNELQEYINDPKIHIIDIFNENETYSKIEKITIEEENNKIINLNEDDDYLKVLEKVYVDEDLYVNTENYIGNKELLNKKLELINNYIQKIIFVESKQEKVRYNIPESKKLLKQYWGYSDFRKLKVYDFESIKDNQKIVKEISQEEIINNIIHQVDSFYKNPNYSYRDIFVTAPTGSGKSIMFLIPAMYFAEKYNMVTLVISPLIGLMNDQVNNIEKTSYKYARTINSDLSQIEKEEIINDIQTGKCHILYLSPESLLAKSDIAQLIGERKIGMVVIDEAHIVTTWGKQFRPDYWYLGDYIKKLRKEQSKDSHPFVLTTFTATAIYGGVEDMYKETLNSLSMHSPITYLGYVKRDDIEIKISEKEAIKPKEEYELDKFDTLIELIQRAEIMYKKTLIYFPTVRLIESFYRYCMTCYNIKNITKYHGQMLPEEKKENASLFTSKEKLIMLATKAFGMGIDISDIEIVCHYAPTGNVCDYVQEIGRAARKQTLKGEAIYYHMKNDFQYINRLHGLSAVKKYQLVKVIQKIYELFQIKLQKESTNNKDIQLSKKRNAMLVDAENFTYIFEGPLESNEDELIAKVKTALLLIQKDYVNKLSYSPFAMRPTTLFAKGYFKITNDIVNKLKEYYGDESFIYCKNSNNIYQVALDVIWDKSYKDKISFPKFKYLLYTNSEELNFLNLNKLISALYVEVEYTKDNSSILIMNAIYNILKKSADEEFFVSSEIEKTEKNANRNIAKQIKNAGKISDFKANTISNILISTIKNYNRNFKKTLNSALYRENSFDKTNNNKNERSPKYMFYRPIYDFIEWIEKAKKYIRKNTKDGILYLTSENDCNMKEIITVLGFLEAVNYLKFKANGGVNSQIYIYINQTKTMLEVINKPYFYKNDLLEKIKERHYFSVAMLSYLYQNKFSSEEIWNYIENYFLGIVPEVVLNNAKLISKKQNT